MLRGYGFFGVGMGMVGCGRGGLEKAIYAVDNLGLV